MYTYIFMQIFGFQFMYILVTLVLVATLILCAVLGKQTDVTEPFGNCRVLGSATVELCPNQITAKIDLPQQYQPQTQSVDQPLPQPVVPPQPQMLPSHPPQMLPIAQPTTPVSPMTPIPTCPFPLEPYESGCKLRCPTPQYLTANPTIQCQRIITGSVQPTTGGKCPEGYSADPLGCLLHLTSCPANYDLLNGVCTEKCPTNTVSSYAEVEIENGSVIEKKKTRVCQAKL
jgi:hypothetical protein